MSSNSTEDIDKALADLNGLLKKRQLDLQQRERELDKKTAALKKDCSSFLMDKSPSDVLHLNVGGALIAVLRRTLTSVEDSMLSSRFSGRWDDMLEKDRDGNFFIDQPVELFLPMVNYLRAKSCETPLSHPVKSPQLKSYDDRQDFYRMVEYFGMTLGIFPCSIELHRGEASTADIVGYPDFSVTSREWSTFTLQTNGHDREIISFEVVLGNVERMQIGWINEDKYIENLSNDPNNGVGEEANSIALDCCRGGLLNQGDFTKLGLSIGEGSVIRCEQKTRRWLVNGKLVVSSNASDDAVHFENELLPPVHGKVDKIIPSFSGKGSWKISQIVLSNP